MKKCTKCNKELPLSEYTRDITKFDGFYSSCKDCYRKKYNMRKGFYQSKLTHGMSKKRIYRTWRSILERCYYPSSSGWKNYGGRGIKCEWNSFEEFYRDMSEGYSDSLEIDRIDPNGNYCKDNCRWATILEQARNRRNVKIFEYKECLLSIPELSIKYGIKAQTLRNRINIGYSISEAIEIPMHMNSGNKSQ